MTKCQFIFRVKSPPRRLLHLHSFNLVSHVKYYLLGPVHVASRVRAMIHLSCISLYCNTHVALVFLVNWLLLFCVTSLHVASEAAVAVVSRLHTYVSVYFIYSSACTYISVCCSQLSESPRRLQ